MGGPSLLQWIRDQNLGERRVGTITDPDPPKKEALT
jgi:hypothetical protein